MTRPRCQCGHLRADHLIGSQICARCSCIAYRAVPNLKRQKLLESELTRGRATAKLGGEQLRALLVDPSRGTLPNPGLRRTAIPKKKTGLARFDGRRPKKHNESRPRNMTPWARLKAVTRSQTHRLIKAGKIQREPCCLCDAARAEIYHPDWSDPLTVFWLCRPCRLALYRYMDGREHAAEPSWPRDDRRAP